MSVLAPLVNPGEAAINAYVPEVFRIKLEKVATPLTAFTVSVPVTPEAVELIVTGAVEVVTTLPLPSWIWAVVLKGVPAVPFEGGPEVKTTLEGMPAPIVMLLLVAPVSPADAACSVYVPDVVRIRLVNAATPPDAGTVVVPATPGAVEVIVTGAVEEVTGLP